MLLCLLCLYNISLLLVLFHVFSWLFVFCISFISRFLSFNDRLPEGGPEREGPPAPVARAPGDGPRRADLAGVLGKGQMGGQP